MAEHKKDRPHTSPKDFFLHLLNIVTLYITAVGFGRLMFVIINYYYPDIIEGYYPQASFDSIRWAISSIIVAYPTYVITSRFLFKGYQINPEKRNLRVKSWLEYFTLFGTAVAILVSLMSIVYKFLGGEITVRFMLKVLTILFIAGTIFTYYVYMVSEKLHKDQKMAAKIIFAIATLGILASIVLGFITHGSPMTQRSRLFDQTRIDNLQQIQNEVINFYTRTKRVPSTLTELEQSLNYQFPTDPETRMPYDYQLTDALNFSLCANFNEDSPNNSQVKGYPAAAPYYSGPYANIYNQTYTKGRFCFPFKINPELYPENVNMIK